MNPTYAQLIAHLTKQGWTEEEIGQFTSYYFRQIEADGTTNLSLEQWDNLAVGF